MTPEEVAARIKLARKKAGLTQVEMAKRFKISRRSIQYWERGEHLPPEWAVDLLLEKLEGTWSIWRGEVDGNDLR